MHIVSVIILFYLNIARNTSGIVGYRGSDVGSIVDGLTLVVSDAMDMFILKYVKHPEKCPKWFSKDLRHYLKLKLHYHRLYKKAKLNVWYEKYSICRKLTKQLLANDQYLYRKQVELSLNKRPDSGAL